MLAMLADQPDQALRIEDRGQVELGRGLLAVAHHAAQMRRVDARAQPRFRGEVEPIDPIAGHIPGAQCAAFSENLDSSGRFLPAEQLKQRFAEKLAGRSPEELVAYCGSGVTACHNLFAMGLAGYPLGKLYAGSWSEWINDPARGIATGD